MVRAWHLVPMQLGQEALDLPCAWESRGFQRARIKYGIEALEVLPRKWKACLDARELNHPNLLLLFVGGDVSPITALEHWQWSWS